MMAGKNPSLALASGNRRDARNRYPFIATCDSSVSVGEHVSEASTQVKIAEFMRVSIVLLNERVEADLLQQRGKAHR
jgi:hypothetical protein